MAVGYATHLEYGLLLVWIVLSGFGLGGFQLARAFGAWWFRLDAWDKGAATVIGGWGLCPGC